MRQCSRRESSGCLCQLNVGLRGAHRGLEQLRASRMRQNLIDATPGHHVAAQKQGDRSLAHRTLGRATRSRISSRSRRLRNARVRGVARSVRAESRSRSKFIGAAHFRGTFGARRAPGGSNGDRGDSIHVGSDKGPSKIAGLPISARRSGTPHPRARVHRRVRIDSHLRGGARIAQVARSRARGRLHAQPKGRPKSSGSCARGAASTCLTRWGGSLTQSTTRRLPGMHLAFQIPERGDPDPRR